MDLQALRINPARLQQHLDALARIGAREDGGVSRLAFSEADKAGRDYVEQRMRALGLEVRVDGIGNIMGVLPGSEDLPPVLAGSHTDTVATGGRYDGSLGVLAALEAVEVITEAGLTTRRPVGVVSFANEEGVRFMPDMMGSLVFTGALSVEEARGIEGTDGTTIGENMDQTGYAGEADFRGMDVHAFLELHIEQGPLLEQKGQTVAAVEGVQGLSWLEFSFEGTANHAGTTPMELRRDAGYVAACLMQYVRELTHEVQDLRATVGSVRFSPNLINVIPERAVVTVDLRSPVAARLREAEDRLQRFLMGRVLGEDIAMQSRRLAGTEPVRFDAGIVATVERASKRLGYRTTRLLSGAGHDAQILAPHLPAAMVFVPSRDGISHNVTEYTSPEDATAGANVLLQTMLDLAG